MRRTARLALALGLLATELAAQDAGGVAHPAPLARNAARLALVVTPDTDRPRGETYPALGLALGGAWHLGGGPRWGVALDARGTAWAPMSADCPLFLDDPTSPRSECGDRMARASLTLGPTAEWAVSGGRGARAVLLLLHLGAGGVLWSERPAPGTTARPLGGRGFAHWGTGLSAPALRRAGAPRVEVRYDAQLRRHAERRSAVIAGVRWSW